MPQPAVRGLQVFWVRNDDGGGDGGVGVGGAGVGSGVVIVVESLATKIFMNAFAGGHNYSLRKTPLF